MLRQIITSAAALCALTSSAILPSDVRWHNEATDTLKITNLLIHASQRDNINSTQGYVGGIAREFINTPYAAGTLEGSEELLTVAIDSVDCTTFVETVAAMAMTVGEGRSSWRDFIHNLQQLRYRQGRIDGYASRLHYVSDWIVDNTHRGIISEVTSTIVPDCGYQVKTIDFMTENRKLYPALADSLTFERLKSVQIGYRSHKFPFIRPNQLSKKQTLARLLDGDIIIFVSKTKGLDVNHLGFVVIDPDGTVKLLHASSRQGKVVVDALPLVTYLAKNPQHAGVRIVRMK